MVRLHRWRLKHLSERGFITVLSIVVGLLAGIAAVIIKNAVRLTQKLVNSLTTSELHNYIYFAVPLLGLFLNGNCCSVHYQARSQARNSQCFTQHFKK